MKLKDLINVLGSAVHFKVVYKNKILYHHYYFEIEVMNMEIDFITTDDDSLLIYLKEENDGN